MPHVKHKQDGRGIESKTRIVFVTTTQECFNGRIRNKCNLSRLRSLRRSQFNSLVLHSRHVVLAFERANIGTFSYQRSLPETSDCDGLLVRWWSCDIAYAASRTRNVPWPFLHSVCWAARWPLLSLVIRMEGQVMSIVITQKRETGSRHPARSEPVGLFRSRNDL